MKANLNPRILCLCATAVSVITSGVFFGLLIKTSFLTGTLLTICGLCLFALCTAVFLLTFDSRKRVSAVIGTVLAVILLLLQFVAGYYIVIGLDALGKITDPNTEFAEVAVYVKTQDPAQTLDDAKDYTFGILSALDRETTDRAASEINAQLEKEITVREYAGLAELLDGLLGDEVNAVILNKSFLDILDETEGHETDAEKLRELCTVKIEADNTTVSQPEEQKNENVFSIYISGIDCSGSVSRRSRSDVNIIATVNVETGQILLLSTPRDYYVPLSISGGVPDKLTHAGIYGINVSKDTLAMLYDTEIDYYFRVNFDGFKEIIDALGGITVYSQYSFTHGKYSFTEGENTLNGSQALAFSRDRYHLPGGDRQRGRNQMAVITAVINKVTSPSLLTNYKGILDSISGSFETSMPYEKISRLVQNQLKNSTKWNIVSYSVDGTGSSQRPYSLGTKAYVMIPDQTTVDHAKALIEQVKNGETPTP